MRWTNPSKNPMRAAPRASTPELKGRGALVLLQEQVSVGLASSRPTVPKNMGFQRNSEAKLPSLT